MTGAPGWRLVEQRSNRRRRPGGRRRLAPVAGALALLAVAVALVTLQHGGRSSSAAGVDPKPAAAARVLADARSKPSPSEAAASKARIFLQYTDTEANAARAGELATFLEQRGFTVAAVRRVHFPIHRPSVRFFFRSDQPDSQRLVEAMAAFFADAPDEVPDHASDFTRDPRKPQPGEIEVWLVTS